MVLGDSMKRMALVTAKVWCQPGTNDTLTVIQYIKHTARMVLAASKGRSLRSNGAKKT